MNILITSFIISLPIAVITAFIAPHRERNGWVWFLIGLVFGIFGLALLIALPLPARKMEKALNSSFPHIPAEGPLLSSASDLPSSYFPDSSIPLIYLNGWHYMEPHSGDMKGPISFHAFKQLWLSGIVNRETFIWNHTEKEWVQLAQRPQYCTWLSLKESEEE